MITKKVAKVWYMPSKSNPSVTYETLQYNDGSLSCNCPGWCKRVATDGTRSCCHVRLIHAGIAKPALDYTHQPLRPQWLVDPSNLKFPSGQTQGQSGQIINQQPGLEIQTTPQKGVSPMRQFKKVGPHYIEARWDSVCAETGTTIPKGTRCLYIPKQTRGKGQVFSIGTSTEIAHRNSAKDWKPRKETMALQLTPAPAHVPAVNPQLVQRLAAAIAQVLKA